MAGRRSEAEAEEVTALLLAWRQGDEPSGEKLLERAYATLRRIAASQLRGERAGHTLQPTALVHEAFLRMLGQRDVDWRDRAHFFGLAAVTMRRILVDHARRRNAVKRRPDELAVPLEVVTEPGQSADILDLDRALDLFAARFPRPAKVVELRYFAGLEFEEIAVALELSSRTVTRDWNFARAWLRDAMSVSG